MKSSFYYNTIRDVVYRKLDFLDLVGYRVGDDGSVWSRRKKGKWKRMKLQVVQEKWNYTRVVISFYNIYGKQVVKRVPRLVLMAFAGPCPKRMEARHFPNQDTTQNQLSNLSWASKTQNYKDREIKGTSNKGERNGRAKLSQRDVLEIIRLYKQGNMTHKQLALKYKVSTGPICRILNGQSWICIA